MTASRSLAIIRRLPSRRSHEAAFLPAALEIVETPPSPIGRAIGATIIAMFSAALAWAWIGHIDIIAVATGKIIPTGRSKVIQPFQLGVIRAIHVSDGAVVKAGDPLIDLDPTIDDAERQHAQSDLIAAQLDIARLHAALDDAADPLADFHPPAAVPPTQLATVEELLKSQVGEQRDKLAAFDRQLAQKEAERDTSAATIAKIQALLPLLQQQVDIRKTLFESQTGSRLVYLQTLQLFVEQQQELLVQKSRYREAAAAVSAIAASRAEAVDEYHRTLSDELNKAEARAAGLAEDLIKAEEKARLERLISPIDGVVQQLAVHTVGGVVTPAQALLVVVPRDSHLEIQAMVSNRDIGFVHAGQQADIKVDTFPYTHYGLLHGTVESVSADAVTPDYRQDGTERPGSANDASRSAANQPANEPVYEARISLDRDRMQIDDALVNLTPGMAVTVEIRTGRRRIISYLLSPLLKYGHESLHER